MERPICLRSVWPAWTVLLVTLTAAAVPASSSSARARDAAGPPARSADSEEVTLALSAAPSTLTTGADVYVGRHGHFVKVRTGTTGFACIVSRDTRLNGVFPMCFDPEAARTLMWDEMMQSELRSQGLPDSTIKQRVVAAYAKGTLHHPDKPAITYMMSSHQDLEVTQADGPHLVGPWRPHVMIYLPHASAAQFALGAEDEHGPVSAPFGDDAGGTQLVIQVPHWADSPASPEGAKATASATR
jgi:hypothetical protein